jgi:hypothetical protein
MTDKEFWEFAKDKSIINLSDAIKKYYDNKYRLFNENAEFIYSTFEQFHDVAYYYDKKHNIIVETRYYIGD